MTLWRRMLIPAAAALILAALIPLAENAGWFGRAEPAQHPAITHLFADARHLVTLDDITGLEPVARRAMDEAMAELNPDVASVANIQLIHYITLRAVEPGQADDIYFLLALLQDQRADKPAAVVLRRSRWHTLAGLGTTACAATPVAWLHDVRRLLSSGRYEDAFQMLAASDATRIQPLTAYAAIRADRPDDARQLLEALIEMERGDQRLVALLWAELAMAEQQFDLAVRHYVNAAESDSRLWFQAAYLTKYELNDDAVAGQLFQRAGSDRVAAHVTARFTSDLDRARKDAQLFAQNFDALPVGSAPPEWRLIPTHAGEYQIAHVDGSNVLKLNELGHHGAKLYTGYPGWHNYTLAADFKFLRRGKDPSLELVVYEHGVDRYALILKARDAHLVHNAYQRTLTPKAARITLDKPIEAGQWWRSTLEVQNLDKRRTRIRVTVWPRTDPKPAEPQIDWTQTAADNGRPLQRGIVAFRVTEAEVAFDNVAVTTNENAAP